MKNINKFANNASSSGKYLNTGNGSSLQIIDIKHKEYIGVVAPDTAFWALVKKDQLHKVFDDPKYISSYLKKSGQFKKEIDDLRFNLKPSAVYFNPTDRCNLNCSYCYIPEKLRKNGDNMTPKRLLQALEILKRYFTESLGKEHRPQIVFHGAEPMVNHEAMFPAIDKFGDYFRFGIQSNGTLLDDTALKFLTSRGISIGLSLDGPTAGIADKTRKTWAGKGVSHTTIDLIKRLKGYRNYSVICTVTKENMRSLNETVELLHKLEVPTCMLNQVRCTLPGGQKAKPADADMAAYYMKALDHAHSLYKKTGRKIVVANFANILLSILAPSGRKLMCDISPCGGGRCFFAVSAQGNMFPCSEFIGLKKFQGGNLFKDNIQDVLRSEPFKLVTRRKVEDIEPCAHCAIRHFCGSPCPAEAHEIHGSMQKPGAFCELYEEQARYAFRVIADGKEDAYLWDNWKSGMTEAL